MSIDSDSLGNVYIFYRYKNVFKIDHYLSCKNTYSFNLNDIDIDFAQIIGERFLLVSAVTSKDKDNAFLFDKKANLLDSFNIGSGIEACKVGEGDKIWIGYSDEGIYEPNSIGENGIVCFDSKGKVIFNEFNGFMLKKDIPCIDHCKTITIFQNEIWISYYNNNYPIVQLTDNNKKVNLWCELDTDPVECMAVGKERILIKTTKSTLSLNYENGSMNEAIFLDDKGGEIIFDKVFSSGNKLFGLTEENVYVACI